MSDEATPGGAGCAWESGRHTVERDGQERTYKVLVADPDGPVVLLLHGFMGNAESILASSGFADANVGVIVAPDGRWGAWRSSGSDTSDVDFLAALLCGADVHAVGFSNGGMLAIRLACEGLVDSAVAVAGMVRIDPCDHHPPLLVIHGKADQTVGWDGRMPPEVSLLTGYRQGPTVPELVDVWGSAELVAHDGAHVWPEDAAGLAWGFFADPG